MFAYVQNFEKISIVVPCYNVAKYLNKCVRSILSQSYKQLEILLIDDGSTDKTPMLCERWKKRDSRVRVFHKANGGVSSARNVGIQHATGEYIMFVDPDDWIDKRMVEKLLTAANDLKLDIIGCGYFRFFLGITRSIFPPFKCNIVYDSEFILRRIIKPLIINGNTPMATFNIWAKLFRRSLLLKYNLLFDEAWDHAEDVQFMIRALNKAQSLYFIDTAYYYYAKHITTKTLTSNMSPNKFAQRVRYRLFIDDVAFNLFNIDPKDKKTPSIIMDYAHEEGINIYKNIKSSEKRHQYLNCIFTSDSYKNAVSQCIISELPNYLALEKKYVECNNFKSWCNVISDYISYDDNYN